MVLEIIQTFTSLFAHCGFKNPLGSATYFSFLIIKFPTTFRNISKEAQTILGTQLRLNQLRAGRVELLKRGFIAEAILQDEMMDFGREMFIPISPEFVWIENVEKMHSVVSYDDLNHRRKKVNELQEVYQNKFGKYRLGIKKGNITMFHGSRWLLHTLIYNIRTNKDLLMLVGSLDLLERPYFNYFENMLLHGLEVKLMYDPNNIEYNKQIEILLRLKKMYPKNIDIKYNYLFPKTSNMFVSDNMVIDCRKILSSNNYKNPFYISTIYIEKKFIETFKSNFTSSWENATKS
jgi:hypothetical protein